MANIEPSHFFKAHKSPRRLANITSLNGLLAGPMKGRIADPYAQCEELAGWDLYVVDGHYHRAACFDPKHENANGELRAPATGHFFRMIFQCLTHNLLLLFEEHIGQSEGLRDELEEKKQQGRTDPIWERYKPSVAHIHWETVARRSSGRCAGRTTWPAASGMCARR